ncbi:MAG: thioredoxin family protein [Winogradskyella sp.]|nr:MAG: thioredoxin family protein [Winogradskyella sp.]
MEKNKKFNIKAILKYKIAIAVIGILYATYLIIQNPQPFGKLALIAFIVFGLSLLIKHKIVERVLLTVSIVAGLLFSVLGARSLMLNESVEDFFEADTEVVFSKLSFSESLKIAEVKDKLLFVDFYTIWCAPCVKFHKDVLNNEEVAYYMNDAFVNLKFNLYKGEGIQLKEKYNVYYVPRFLILDPKGNIIEDISTDSILTAERMIKISKKYNK